MKKRSSKDPALIRLGKIFKNARQKLGLSQEKVAALADPMHPTYYSSIERGERNVSYHNLSKLIKALQLDPRMVFPK